MAEDNRCGSRLTTESLDFTGPLTFRCSLGAGHFPMEPHTWALVWTDLGADPVEQITEGRLHSVSIGNDGPGTISPEASPPSEDWRYLDGPRPEFNSPEYWAQLQDNAGKDRP